MLLQTTDYTIFKKSKLNRALDDANVNKIMRSIAAKNLLEYRPLLVNASMEVMDGQHRLEAAKKLGVPVFYEIQVNNEIEDIIKLNIQKAWKHQDYLNFYCAKGVEDYVKFQRFSERHNCDFYTACRVLNLRLGGQGDANTSRSSFKSGTWKYPCDEAEKVSIDKLEKFRTTMDFLKGKSLREPKLLFAAKFKDCLFDILNVEDFDFLGFLRNMEMHIDKLGLRATYSGYRLMLSEIYNFRRREGRIEI